MAKAPTFPIVIKAGATAIKIYYNPLRIKIGGGPDTTPIQKQYDSYVVSYYRGGTRIRRRCNTLEEARTEAQNVQRKVLNEDITALELTGKDRLSYGVAASIANELGISLDTMAREFADAKKKLGTVSLIAAAEFYDRYGKSIKEWKTVPEVFQELLAALKADNLSTYHLLDMERRLTVFATAFPGKILDVNTKQITEWLRALKGKTRTGEEMPIVAKTKNHYRNAVVQLFNFARDHGYLPRGLPTEAEDVKALNTTPSPNEIFTVAEMKTILETAPAYLIAPLAIKAFSGVRTEEMLRMKWEHINWDTKHIRLPAEVTKTSLKRLIPMQPNLEKWIAPFKDEKGQICARWQRPQALYQAFERHGLRQKVDVGANKFRNSYITYRVAVTHDVQRVSLECGNSPQMIQREYLELVTEDEGKKWFEIVPTKKVSMPKTSVNIKLPKILKDRIKQEVPSSSIPTLDVLNQNNGPETLEGALPSS